MGERDDGRGPMSPEVAVMVLQSELEQSPKLVAEAVTALAGLVDSVMASPYGDVVDRDGQPMAWHFVGYRPDAAALGKHSVDTLNAPELPQYQGVIFADGTVTVRTLTRVRSWGTWDSFAEFYATGSGEELARIVWPTGDAPTDALEVIATAVEELERKRAQEAEVAAAPDLHVVAPSERTDTRTLLERARERVVPAELDPDGAHARAIRVEREAAESYRQERGGWSVGSLGELTEEQTLEILEGTQHAEDGDR
jgi:hypothetical protein